jgi:seryl-tRNA synthetase
MPRRYLWGPQGGNPDRPQPVARVNVVLDLRLLRTDFEACAAALARRGEDLGPLERVRELDAAHRSAETERNNLRSEVKALSRQVAELRRAGNDEEASALAERSRQLGDAERALASDSDELQASLRELLLVIPNLPAPDAPDGGGPPDNVVVRHHGWDPAADPQGPWADHQRVAHWDIGSELGILDLERAVKLSGSMFTMFRGPGATLSRALCQLALDANADAFEEVRPPSLVLGDTMISTGHLPKFADDAYHAERDDLWAIPTAEVPLTSLARDEILDEADLPMRLMAHTACFRREAGSAGRDTRGLLRVHEFDKVEILAYCTPDQAAATHADLLARAERLLDQLGLSYRVLDLCAGDLGQSARRTFDLEVYAPGVGQWLECSSVSWFGDYQARRARIRYRPADGGQPAPLHTLNGSALAVPRVWAAVVETHRQPDGSVRLPEVLHPYMRGMTSITTTG